MTVGSVDFAVQLEGDGEMVGASGVVEDRAILDPREQRRRDESEVDAAASIRFAVKQARSAAKS